MTKAVINIFKLIILLYKSLFLCNKFFIKFLEIIKHSWKQNSCSLSYKYSKINGLARIIHGIYKIKFSPLCYLFMTYLALASM